MKTTKALTLAGVTAALYVALTMISTALNLAFGPVQLRLGEALTVLPFLFPCTTWGLFAGCLICNILSPYGFLDLVVGSLTTLLAAYLTARCKKKWLAPLPPVLLNGVLCGALIAWQMTGFTQGFAAAFAMNFLSVSFGQLLMCYGLGGLLLHHLPKVKHLPFGL